MLGRWQRAKNLLRPDERRVLDAGCGFGFGTARLLPERAAIGLERSEFYIALARARYPSLVLVRGDVSALPFRDCIFDAVLLLDVLEHLPSPGTAVREAHRVLRPGGSLICSLPHAGPLAGLDSLNLYQSWAAKLGWPPLDATEASHPVHRHFSVAEVYALLAGFTVQRVDLTGLGIGEPVHLLLLTVLRGVLRAESLYATLRFLAFGISVLDDLIPAGRLSYNLHVRAVKMSPKAPMDETGHYPCRDADRA